MILQTLFWVLWLLWVIGFFVPLPAATGKFHGALGVILVGILGCRVMGNPLEK